MEEQKENNNNNNKLNIHPINSFPKKKRKSVQLGLDQLNHIVENYSFKMKNIEGNKFKNIPKNQKLTNLSLILINKEIQPPSNKDKNYYLKLLKNTDQSFEKEEKENAFIKKKLKEMNERVAILQTGRKRNKRKGKTIKEKNNFINPLKKIAKIKKKRKGSFNVEDKNSKNSGSKKKKKKKFNSSSSIVKMKEKQAKEIDNIRHIINGEEKVKKLYLISEKKESEDKKISEEQNKDSSAKMSNSVTNNDYKIYIKKVDENDNKNDNKNDNNTDNNNTNNNKQNEDNKIINKKDKNKKEVKIKKETNKKEKKKEVTNINNNININYIETKNNYEVKKEENKENKKNKKRKFFCFCCLTKEDNSSDFD